MKRFEPITGKEIDFKWFGSMVGGGYFKNRINTNNNHLAIAIDSIPLHGEITRDMYLGYINEMAKGFLEGGFGIAIATRLLAMKRPDYFVCLDSKNKERLCKSFEISASVDFEKYWDSIVERIIDSVWWTSSQPEGNQERLVWESRAAFLDAIFYDA